MNIKKDLKKNNAVKSFFPYFILILVVAGVFFMLSRRTFTSIKGFKSYRD